MRKHLLLSFVPLALALTATGPPAPAHADESAQPDRAMLLADNAPSMQHGNGFGIVTVSAPQPLPAGKASVTPGTRSRRPSCRYRFRYRNRATCSTRWKATLRAIRVSEAAPQNSIRIP